MVDSDTTKQKNIGDNMVFYNIWIVFRITIWLIFVYNWQLLQSTEYLDQYVLPVKVCTHYDQTWFPNAIIFIFKTPYKLT